MFSVTSKDLKLYCTIPLYCFINSKTFQSSSSKRYPCSSSNGPRFVQASIGEAFIAVFQTPLPDIVLEKIEGLSPLSFDWFRREREREREEKSNRESRILESIIRDAPYTGSVFCKGRRKRLVAGCVFYFFYLSRPAERLS